MICFGTASRFAITLFMVFNFFFHLKKTKLFAVSLSLSRQSVVDRLTCFISQNKQGF